MTCTIKEGVALPESTQQIIAGFGTGQIVGPAGTVELARTNPVEFRKQRNNEMIVVNHFYLPNSETLLGSPISRITNYDKLVVPITVLGSGDIFDTVTFIEVTVTINNKYTWYYPYRIGTVPFQPGLTVTIPLAGIEKALPLESAGVSDKKKSESRANEARAIPSAPKESRPRNPRTLSLTPDLEGRLVNALSGVGGKAVITINFGDHESRELATQLISAFQHAQWQVNDTPNVHMNAVPIQGLQISSVYGGSAPMESVYQALRGIGFHPYKQLQSQPQADTVYIFVGVKE